MRVLPASLLLTACWTSFEPVEYEQVPFQNEHVLSEQGVVTTYQLNLLCPDGDKARFYTVHDPTFEGPLPIAVVLHSSAFDYVTDPVSLAPLAGAHYAARYEETHRLERDWGVMKVWETLGMHPQVETVETNSGTLPAALLDAGVAAFYPINCWGDLWHNSEVHTNDLAAEFFPRWGGTFAAWMARLVQDSDFAGLQGVEFPFEPDQQGIHLIGLGDGARGVVSILKSPDKPDLASIFVDSPVDDLSIWATDPAFEAEATGLHLIFSYSNQAPDWNAWTLKALINQGFADGARVGLAFSRADPRVPFPQDSFNNLIASVNNHEQGLVIESFDATHVQVNNDLDRSNQVVNFLLDRPAEPEPEPEG
ncbi:MAG: hypothetical protein VXW32_09785 [Myxococcota bacterium]|nr:hypothetical protein [Myxococcota bacterium]